MTQAYNYRSPASQLADAARDMENQCWDIGNMLDKLMRSNRTVDPHLRTAISDMAFKLREVSAEHEQAREKETIWRRTPITTPVVPAFGSKPGLPTTAIVKPTTSSPLP